MRERDDPRPVGPRRRGRWLTMLALALALAGCTGDGDGGAAISPGGPEIRMGNPPPTTVPGGTTPGGTPAVPSPGSPGSGGRVAGGSGNAGAEGTPSRATSGATAAGDPGVAVDVGGPMLFVPNLRPRSESFGEVAVGTVSDPRSFQVRSPLAYPSTVVALEPSDASFQITENGCTGVTLPPSGSGGCTVTVTFSPRASGETSAGITARMTHTCTADTYIPCSWTLEQIHAPGTAPNFTRVVLPSGQVRFDWTTTLDARLVGQGTEAADPSTPPAP
jgi:hypothetical protein